MRVTKPPRHAINETRKPFREVFHRPRSIAYRKKIYPGSDDGEQRTPSNANAAAATLSFTARNEMHLKNSQTGQTEHCTARLGSVQQSTEWAQVTGRHVGSAQVPENRQNIGPHICNTNMAGKSGYKYQNCKSTTDSDSETKYYFCFSIASLWPQPD